MPTDKIALILSRLDAVQEDVREGRKENREMREEMATKDEMYRSHAAIAKTVSEGLADVKGRIRSHIEDTEPLLRKHDEYIKRQETVFGAIRPLGIFFVGIFSSVLTALLLRFL